MTDQIAGVVELRSVSDLARAQSRSITVARVTAADSVVGGCGTREALPHAPTTASELFPCKLLAPGAVAGVVTAVTAALGSVLWLLTFLLMRCAAGWVRHDRLVRRH